MRLKGADLKVGLYKRWRDPKWVRDLKSERKLKEIS